jgi:hypothetical protein
MPTVRPSTTGRTAARRLIQPLSRAAGPCTPLGGRPASRHAARPSPFAPASNHSAPLPCTPGATAPLAACAVTAQLRGGGSGIGTRFGSSRQNREGVQMVGRRELVAQGPVFDLGYHYSGNDARTGEVSRNFGSGRTRLGGVKADKEKCPWLTRDTPGL